MNLSLPQLSVAERQLRPLGEAGSAEKKPLLKRSSIDELISLARNPYNLSQSALRRSDKNIGRHSPELGTTPRRIQPQPRALPRKSVPFGSGALRPLGEMPIEHFQQFTYIPDVRRIHAMTNAQIKQQRQLQRIQQQPIKRVPSLSTLSSGVYLQYTPSKSTIEKHKKPDTESTYGSSLAKVGFSRLQQKQQNLRQTEEGRGKSTQAVHFPTQPGAAHADAQDHSAQADSTASLANADYDGGVQLVKKANLPTLTHSISNGNITAESQNNILRSAEANVSQKVHEANDGNQITIKVSEFDSRSGKYLKGSIVQKGPSFLGANPDFVINQAPKAHWTPQIRNKINFAHPRPVDKDQRRLLRNEMSVQQMSYNSVSIERELVKARHMSQDRSDVSPAHNVTTTLHAKHESEISVRRPQNSSLDSITIRQLLPTDPQLKANEVPQKTSR